MDNADAKSVEFKVVVAGPFGVGKTTLISNISVVPIVGTEVSTTGDEALEKETTTVGLEYGRFTVTTSEFDIDLLLFGTPGQERFRFMWETASVGADGFIVLVDAGRPDSWSEAAEALDYFGGHHGSVTIVGANRAQPDSAELGAVTEWIAQRSDVPVVPCNVTDDASARQLLSALFDRLIGDDEADESFDVAVTPTPEPALP